MAKAIEGAWAGSPWRESGRARSAGLKLADILEEGEPEAAVVVQRAIEEFSQQLAVVIQKFLKVKG